MDGKISEVLTQRHMKKILVCACRKGRETDRIDVKELVEEIRRQIVAVVASLPNDSVEGAVRHE